MVRGRTDIYGEKTFVEFRIEIIVEPDGDGFHAYCPALIGLHTNGDTEQEAVKNARGAAIAYLESLIKHHDPIPVGIVVEKEPVETPRLLKHHVSRHTEDLRVACAI